MKNKTVIAILIVVFIKKLIVLITTILLFVGTFTFNTVYDNYDNREGKILNSSDGIFELLDEVPALQIDAINITGCKWYEQIALKDGNSFTFFTYICYDGKIVLEENYFKQIVSKYKWEKFSNPQTPNFIEEAMYKTSMIKECLKTKILYTCDDPIFSDGCVYFTFLDKENKTLYFYYFDE